MNICYGDNNCYACEKNQYFFFFLVNIKVALMANICIKSTFSILVFFVFWSKSTLLSLALTGNQFLAGVMFLSCKQMCTFKILVCFFFLSPCHGNQSRSSDDLIRKWTYTKEMDIIVHLFRKKQNYQTTSRIKRGLNQYKYTKIRSKIPQINNIFNLRSIFISRIIFFSVR